MSDREMSRKMKLQVAIHAPPDVVWRALTDQAALQTWLAEHVVMEPWLGGKMALWGHGAYGAAIPVDSGAKVFEVEPCARLGLEFPLNGASARLTIVIEPAANGVVVNSNYELPEDQGPMPWYLTHDSAQMLLYNLRSYAESGETGLLPDMPDEDRTVRMAITVSAPPTDVFAALTSPEVMDRWISSAATVDLRPGGQYLFGWTETLEDGSVIPMGPLEVIDVVQDRLLSYTWRYSIEMPTQVEWRIEGDGGSTIVRLTHSGFGPEDDAPAYVQGWAAFLCILRALLENKPRVETT